ncbi:GNAT family N-acetyltransferase [Edaphosphingomonas haloaromaticamans]|uniref:N-acetyltransferase domain-containing protein n=1 Tax=Edaphosphingomonas haloaromaticamans TaxID=653954 RepID=A0A1S1H7T3_9SPHN|nr:GNAT family protein [Sphingomonas haloaromaticamans]OHT18198.1 hypothetical protein BHE75_00167 [Sphingomonas haloaromaticamans]
MSTGASEALARPDTPSAGPRGAPVHIETNGYVLRSLSPADVTPRFAAWLNDAPLRDGLNLPPLDFSLERLRAFVASFNDLHHYFVGIFDRDQGALAGFYTLDVDLNHKVGNITTGLDPAFADRPVQAATIDAFLDHMFAFRDVDKIVARVLAGNRAMVEKLDASPRFHFEARLRQECLTASGERLDLVLFAAFRTEPKEDGTAL